MQFVAMQPIFVDKFGANISMRCLVILYTRTLTGVGKKYPACVAV